MIRFRQALEQARRDRAPRTGIAAEGVRTTDAWSWQSEGAEPLGGSEPPRQTAERVDDHLVSLVTSAAFEADQYRALRHVLEQARRTSSVQVVAVSSAGVGDGKTITAINTAGALAQAREARVLLVDADLRKPSVAQRLALGEPTRPGLVEAILNPGLRLDQVVRAMPAFNLHVLPAGSVPLTPYEILQSPRLGDVLAEARRSYDHIVLDTAPLVPVPDTRLLARWIDGVLLVVTAHRTRSGQLADALDLLDPARLLGLVFNGDDDTRSPHDYRRDDVPTNGHGRQGHRPTWWSPFRRRSKVVSPDV
jgi:capsular exopolysaccharide synthesis family protein